MGHGDTVSVYRIEKEQEQSSGKGLAGRKTEDYARAG
jgi:hypothetical protein